MSVPTVNPRCVQRRRHQIARASDVARGGQDDHLPGPRVRDHGRARRPKGHEVGDLVGVDRGRHAHDHGIGIGEGAGIGGEPEGVAVEREPQAGVIIGHEIDVAATDGVEPRLADLERDELGARLVQAQGCRQPDIAQPDDGDRGSLHGDHRSEIGRRLGREIEDLEAPRGRLVDDAGASPTRAVGLKSQRVAP